MNSATHCGIRTYLEKRAGIGQPQLMIPPQLQQALQRQAFVAEQAANPLTPLGLAGTHFGFGETSPLRTFPSGIRQGIRAYRAAVPSVGRLSALRSAVGASAGRVGRLMGVTHAKAMRDVAQAIPTLSRAGRLASVGRHLGAVGMGIGRATPAFLGIDALILGLKALGDPSMRQWYSSIKNKLGGGILGTTTGILGSIPYLPVSMGRVATAEGMDMLRKMEQSKGLGKAVRVLGSGIVNPIASPFALGSTVLGSISAGRKLRQTRDAIRLAQAQLASLRGGF